MRGEKLFRRTKSNILRESIPHFEKGARGIA
jgi:hypothetical protein